MPIQFELAKYVNPVFVETGTYKGGGIAAALAAGFSKVYSIEVSEEFYNNAVQRFKPEIEQGIVEIILGDSLSCLPEVINKIDKKITFWLDAHTTLGYEGEKSCPLYEELEAISHHPIKDHTILIDDLRLLSQEGWGISINQLKVIEIIQKINSNYSINHDNGKIENDVLVALITHS